MRKKRGKMPLIDEKEPTTRTKKLTLETENAVRTST